MPVTEARHEHAQQIHKLHVILARQHFRHIGMIQTVYVKIYTVYEHKVIFHLRPQQAESLCFFGGCILFGKVMAV